MDGNPQIKTLKNRTFTKYRVISDGAGWSLDWDARNVAEALEALGLRKAFLPSRKTLIYFTSRDHFLRYTNLLRLVPPGTVVVDHFHGTPADDAKYEKYFEGYRRHRTKLFGIRVTNNSSNAEFARYDLNQLLRVIRIPVDTTLFYLETEKQSEIRATLGIGRSDFVVGSFQKDGVGWGEGLQPKLEKGPDILVESLIQVRQEVPNLHVLLTGPARGYVCSRLEQEGVAFSWIQDLEYERLRRCYAALDVYVITSRLEGGPKGALEALACGVPVVSTPVGQVPDLALEECGSVVVKDFSPPSIATAILDLKNQLPTRNRAIEVARGHDLKRYLEEMRDWLGG